MLKSVLIKAGLKKCVKKSWVNKSVFKEWSRRIAQLLKLFFLTENVEGDHVDLGVSVLSGLGGGHVDDLAGVALDHDELVLAQSRALLGVGEGSARSGLVEIEFFLVVRHATTLKIHIHRNVAN